MKKFMQNDFLLSTATAEKLYKDYAEKTPIVDYHCHLVPAEIAENKQFKNITEAWLYADHYKWRAIRACGFEEKYVTGGASDYDRFKVWAATMPNLLGNPLYHWTHLELARYFDIHTPLNEKTCDEIWEKCNAALASGKMGAKDLIKMSDVKVICTTDDPADTLEYHEKIAADKDFDTKVLPAFRPDKAVNIEKDGFKEYIADKLSKSYGSSIQCLDDLLAAMLKSLDHFEKLGCKTSDHGMDYVPYEPCTAKEADEIFKTALSGKKLTAEQADKYKTFMLSFFASEFTKRDWVMQIHYGVIRNQSSKNFALLGPDAGFDTIAGYDCVRNALRLLDSFETAGNLPKMVFYSLNPVENAAIDAMCGCFQGNDKKIRSKIQHGSAWWFNDHLEGMREQLKTFAATGVLANFIGMLTDSRSFLSYTRHDYFRRILCDYVGSLIENGEYPDDIEAAGQIIYNISYKNALDFFGFNN